MKAEKAIWLFFLLYARICTTARLDTALTVVTSVGAQEVKLGCHYFMDSPQEPYNLKWERNRKDGPLVLERNSLGDITYGQGFKDRVCLGDNCTLVITTATSDLGGIYSVTIHPSIGTELFSNTELVICKDIPAESTTMLTVKMPKESVTLPCNYTLENKESVVVIWKRGQLDGSVILRQDKGVVTYGRQYAGRVNLVDECSLVMLNPQVMDSGNYSVYICYSHCPDKRTDVQLQVDSSDRQISFNLLFLIPILGVPTLCLTSGVIIVCVCCKPKRKKERSTPEETEEMTPNNKR